LEFWKQPEGLKELEQTLKARLKANGEKVAETVTNLAGRLWGWRSMYDVEILPPGYTGVEFHFLRITSTFTLKLPEITTRKRNSSYDTVGTTTFFGDLY